MKSLVVHWKEISMGGWPTLKRKTTSLLRKIKNYLALVFIAPLAVPFLMLLRVIRPWHLIRFGFFRNERIGHFAADVGHHYARKLLAPSHTSDWYWLPEGQSCNTFFDKMVRRNFKVYPFTSYLYRWNQLLPFGIPHSLPSATTGSRDLEGVLEKSPSMLPFLPKEDMAAQRWLEEQGWHKGDSFVCLQVRDNSYLNTEYVGSDWNYHNYRDSDIATYVKASEWLADQGVWVLRMGKIMKQPMPTNHPRIIDYAFHPGKSDFLDIWLFAHCGLCISTGTGPDMVSDIYRRPLLLINFMPLRNLFSWSDAIHVPKHLIWKKTQTYLTWSDHLKNSYSETKQYDDFGIEIVDLSPDEILLAVQEAWLSLQGSWVESEGNSQRQARFWQVLRSDPEFDSLHCWIHSKSRVVDYWLKKMGDDFLN